MSCDVNYFERWSAMYGSDGIPSHERELVSTKPWTSFSSIALDTLGGTMIHWEGQLGLGAETVGVLADGVVG